jgi:uncharacterized protein YbcC (UPF0753/DUF2309 family)
MTKERPMSNALASSPLPAAPAAAAGGAAAVRAAVAAACGRIPPVWDLPNYVAVNPFLGFAGRPIAAAAQTIGDGLGARVLPGFDYYRGQWARRAFGPADLAAAAGRTGVSPDLLAAVLAAGPEPRARRAATLVLTRAEAYDRVHGTDWQDRLARSVARWCAVYASEHAPQGVLPAGRPGLYASWREAAGVDRSLEIMGLPGWRAWARSLPAGAEDAAGRLYDRLPLPPEDRIEYLYRLLGKLYGWASFFRRGNWQDGPSAAGGAGDLLTILMCVDAAVARLPGAPPAALPRETRLVEEEGVQLALQEAVEDGYVRGLLGALNPPPPASPAARRPAVQAVFCIDVRSEPLRRHLEAQSADIETRGFAGFFGVSLDWRADGGPSARCPVLLTPGVTLRPLGGRAGGPLAAAGRRLQAAPAGAFSFVELLGLAYGLKLAADAAGILPAAASADGAAAFALDADGAGGGLPAARRADLAAAILKNMGLGKTVARLVLLCGHEGHSANNPHAAGLDCGACGGHGGAINARVAAAVLNDPAARAGLAVPGDTHFLPAVHDTSTDEVRLLDVAAVPATHAADVAALRAWLAAAGAAARRERAPGLGLGAPPAGRLARLLRRRARDAAEVRPEWALAGNAAFIAARRGRTRGADLGGRAFLHEYDAAADPDAAVLTLILSAPMVVAAWINLQYFASTVDNDVFGCGNKALHHRVGPLGVVLGNGGDLRTGLAAQSVHAADGSWRHAPLRLQVVVEAPRGRIDAVLAAKLGVRDLVDNGWVRLFALDPDSAAVHRRVPGGGWAAAGAAR